MAKLTPDYIEWVMSLNATQASREIHKLNEENKELSRQQNAARQAMTKLAAEGKKGSKEWQNLKKTVINGFFMGIGQQLTTVVCPHCGKPVTVELK